MPYPQGGVQSVSATTYIVQPMTPPAGNPNSYYYAQPLLILDDGTCGNGYGWLTAGIQESVIGTTAYFTRQ
jgi:hypothetical protein